VPLVTEKDLLQALQRQRGEPLALRQSHTVGHSQCGQTGLPSVAAQRIRRKAVSASSVVMRRTAPRERVLARLERRKWEDISISQVAVSCHLR